MDPIQSEGNAAAESEFDAQFEESMNDAIITAGITVGSSIMNQMLTNFSESNAELDS